MVVKTREISLLLKSKMDLTGLLSNNQYLIGSRVLKLILMKCMGISTIYHLLSSKITIITKSK